MGNVMTPFFPPKAAFIPKVVNILASGPYAASYFVEITAAQAENDIIYLSGTGTNAGTLTATTKLLYFDLPTTASTKVYAFNVGNVTLASAFSYTLGITTGKAGTAVDFDVSTSFQVAYSATGYGAGGVPTVKVITASNIYFST